MVVRESTLAGRTPRNLPQGITVVDLDVHIHETPGVLAPYCEMPWRKTLEHLSTLPYRYLDMPAFAPTAGIWPSFPETRGKRRSTAASPAELRRDLDDLGVDIAVMFPDHLLLHAALKQTSYAVALARAYNRWLEAEWLGQDAGLKGSIIAPHHDPVAAAAEVRRYASNVDVAAIYLPTSCVEPLYGHRRYDPLYEAAQETGLPVVMHSVAAVHPAFPFNLHGFETSFSAHILAHPFSPDREPGEYDRDRRPGPLSRVENRFYRGRHCLGAVDHASHGQGIQRKSAGCADSEGSGQALMSGECSLPPSRSKSRSGCA